MATETHHRLPKRQQMILRPPLWGQRMQSWTRMLVKTTARPLSHRLPPNQTRAMEARKAQVPPSSRNRETVKGLIQYSQDSPGPANHNHRNPALYEHPHHPELNLRHRQKAASCQI